MPLSRSLLSRRISISFRDQGKTTSEADSYESAILPPSSDMAGSSSWSAMLTELLGEIIRRVEESEDQWPQRRDVVTCACVSKQWRGITQDIVRSPLLGHFNEIETNRPNRLSFATPFFLKNVDIGQRLIQRKFRPFCVNRNGSSPFSVFLADFLKKSAIF